MNRLVARRALRWTGISAAVAAPVAVGVTYAAVRTLTDAPAPKVRRPTVTARFLDAHVVAVVGDRANDAGTWGMSLDGAFVRIGDPIGWDGEAVLRPYTVLDGVAPTRAVLTDRRVGPRRERTRRADGEPRTAEVRAERRAEERAERRRRDRRRAQHPPPWPMPAVITPYAWPDDPQVLARHAGATFRLDGVRSEGHVLPVWILEPPEAKDTWVIGVHGRGSPRTELFRLAEVALGLGHPVLLASYRTDHWTGRHTPVTTLGTVEWRDVEANLAAALAHGARHVVLAGCSLGGGLVAHVVRRSRLAPWVTGVILDSPALTWGRILRFVAAKRGLPSFMVGPVMAAARLRSAVDWSAIDHLSAVDEFSQPVLLLHGAEDDVVPVWLSEAFAMARPELVTFERFPDADHVTSWNHAPLRYERAVRRFLTRIAPVV